MSTQTPPETNSTGTAKSADAGIKKKTSIATASVKAGDQDSRRSTSAFSAIAVRIMNQSALDIRNHKLWIAVLAQIKKAMEITISGVARQCVLSAFQNNTEVKKVRGKSRTLTAGGLLTTNETGELLTQFAGMSFTDNTSLAEIGDQIETHLLKEFSPAATRRIIVEVIDREESLKADPAARRSSGKRKSESGGGQNEPLPGKSTEASASIVNGPMPSDSTIPGTRKLAGNPTGNSRSAADGVLFS